MKGWRTCFWRISAAALGPAALWASPFGPARDLTTAAKLLFLGYPAWLLLSLVWLLPGIALARLLKWRERWVVPCAAVLVQFVIGAVESWPPSRWGVPVSVSILSVPGRDNPPFVVPSSGSAFGISFEAWYGYFYSQWAYCFIAFIAAMTWLLVNAVTPHALTFVGADTWRVSVKGERRVDGPG
jgi:hypothetical protein